MSKRMIDAIDRVLTARLNIVNVDQAETAISELIDEQKIDLLDELIEATINYLEGPEKISPGTPLIPPPTLIDGDSSERGSFAISL